MSAWVRAALIGLLLTVLLGFRAASARDWIDQVWIIEDPTRSLSLEEIRSRTDWQPAGPYLSLGFRSSAFWLRVDRGPDALPIPLRLRIRPAFLDHVDVFAPAGEDRWVLQPLGDRLPRGGNLIRESAFSADIDGRSSGPIFIRLSSVSTIAFHLQLLDEADSYWSASSEHLLFGVYFGLMGFLAIWAFANAWIRRDRSFALFGLYLCMLLGMGLGTTGLAATMFLATVGSDAWTTGFVLASTLSGSGFHRVFLSRFSPPVWSLRVVDITIAGAVLNIILWLFFGPSMPLMMNAWLVLLACLATSIPALIPGKKTPAEHRTLLLSYGIVLVTMGFTMLPVVGVVPAENLNGFFAIHMTMSHGLIVAVTISLALARLGRLELLERQRLKLAEEQSRRELAITTSQNREYDQFLAMLTHELRNALSTATLVIGRLQRGEFPSGGAPAATRSNTSDPTERPPMVPEMGLSLRRASAALRSASSVLDKVQVARQLEVPMAFSASAGGLLDHVNSLLDRLSVDDALVDIDEDLTLIQDWTYLEIILSNLIENADRYRENGSVIHVRAVLQGRARETLILTVRNRLASAWTGDPERVFEKYWRAPHANRQRGAGLGLWLSRNAARTLGGDLSCRVEDNEIVFTLSVPLSLSPATTEPRLSRQS